jgi:parallel beta-helix repeat protein
MLRRGVSAFNDEQVTGVRESGAVSRMSECTRPEVRRVEEEAMKRLYVLCTVLLTATTLGCAEEHGAPTAPSPGGTDAPTASTNGEKVRHVPRDYATIQAAVDAASEGEIIQVGEGIYHENLVITTSGLRLRGSNGAVIEGAGTGTAIHVLGTAGQPVSNVEISGFEIRTFEKGIVAEFGVGIQIHRNDVQHIMNLGSLAAGDGEGVMLWTTRDSEVTGNAVHQNSHFGITLRLGSTNNTIRANRVYETGNPAVVPTSLRGTGIMITGEGTNGNRIVENEILRNYDRGILITRPAGTTPITGNVVAQNRIHESQRSGIAVMLAAAGNFIQQNDARGNNLSGQAPCYQCNLIDLSSAGLGGNTWERNLGAFNLTDSCGQ